MFCLVTTNLDCGVIALSPHSCKDSVTMRSERRLPRRAAVRRTLVAVAAILTATATAFVTVLPPANADEITDKQTQAAQVADKLDALEARQMDLSAQAEKSKSELARAEADVADAEKRSADAQAELTQRQEELRKFAVDAYVSGADAPGIDAILSSQIDDSAKVQGYVDIATGSRQDKIDQLQATRQKAEKEGQALQSARDDLEARHAQLSRSLDDAQSAVDEQQSIKSSLDSQVATLVSAEQARKAQAAQAAAAATAAAASAPRAAAPTGGGTPVRSSSPAPAAPAPPAPSGPAPAVGSGAQFAIDAAMSKLGAPYVWAAAGPDSFDCSGLTMWAWAHGGKSLSHYTGSQWASSAHISAGEAQPGDLVFFWAPGDGGDPGHVGLYLGGGMMVHAPHTGSYVKTESVSYWPGARVAYGRV
jgi:cell wall-associated NlpC family hydrolase